MDEIGIPCDDGFVMPGLFARPPGDGPAPGVVFMYEAWGLNDEMRRLALDLAGRGFAVVLPDLLARGSWLPCVLRLFGDLRRKAGRTFADVDASRRWLAAQPGVAPERLAFLGLCVGGSFALLLGKTGQYRAVVPFYALVPADLAGECPVVASYGSRDTLAKQGRRLETELTRLAIPHDVKVYEGAGHSFLNRPPNRVVGTLMGAMGAGFAPEAAADALERVEAFLRAHL